MGREWGRGRDTKKREGMNPPRCVFPPCEYGPDVANSVSKETNSAPIAGGGCGRGADVCGLSAKAGSPERISCRMSTRSTQFA